MYRRLNAFLAVLVVIVFTMLVIPALTFGMDASGGVSATYMSGHDHGGTHSRDPGVATIFTMEEGILGVSAFWLNFETKADGHHAKSEDKYIISGHVRPRWEVTDDFHLFPLAGPTYNLSDNNWGVLVGGGFDYWIEDIAVSPLVWMIGEQDGNYRGIGLFLRYAF